MNRVVVEMLCAEPLPSKVPLKVLCGPFFCRCFYIAQSYLLVKKWKETLALYERTLDYCFQSLEKYPKSQLEPTKKKKVSVRFAGGGNFKNYLHPKNYAVCNIFLTNTNE